MDLPNLLEPNRESAFVRSCPQTENIHTQGAPADSTQQRGFQAEGTIILTRKEYKALKSRLESELNQKIERQIKENDKIFKNLLRSYRANFKGFKAAFMIGVELTDENNKNRNLDITGNCALRLLERNSTIRKEYGHLYANRLREIQTSLKEQYLAHLDHIELVCNDMVHQGTVKGLENSIADAKQFEPVIIKGSDKWTVQALTTDVDQVEATFNEMTNRRVRDGGLIPPDLELEYRKVTFGADANIKKLFKASAQSRFAPMITDKPASAPAETFENAKSQTTHETPDTIVATATSGIVEAVATHEYTAPSFPLAKIEEKPNSWIFDKLPDSFWEAPPSLKRKRNLEDDNGEGPCTPVAKKSRRGRARYDKS